VRKLAFLPLLALVFACADGNPMQPDDPLPSLSDQPTLAVSEKPAANPKWEFSATLPFLGPVDPGEIRVNPAGILFAEGIVNEFGVDGTLDGEPLTGLWYFIGDYVFNQNEGTGRSRARPVLWVIEESALGEGTFECVGTFKIENALTRMIQYGNITGCHGTGDFAGMRMKAYTTNENTPFPFIYEAWGEIW
jgi:hypothetical protein